MVGSLDIEWRLDDKLGTLVGSITGGLFSEGATFDLVAGCALVGLLSGLALVGLLSGRALVGRLSASPTAGRHHCALVGLLVPALVGRLICALVGRLHAALEGGLSTRCAEVGLLRCVAEVGRDLGLNVLRNVALCGRDDALLKGIREEAALVGRVK